MFPHNEYTEREYHKELLRQAKARHLAHQVGDGNTQSLRERFGYILLMWGVRFTVKDECQRIQTPSGQVVTVCQPSCAY